MTELLGSQWEAEIDGATEAAAIVTRAMKALQAPIPLECERLAVATAAARRGVYRAFGRAMAHE